MSYCSIMALIICAESMGIDSENYLWSKIRQDHKNDFPQLIDRSNFNKRPGRLPLFIHEVTRGKNGELIKEKTFVYWIAFLFQFAKSKGKGFANLEIIPLRLTRAKGIRQFVSSTFMATNYI